MFLWFVLDWLASIHVSVLLRFCVSYLATLEAIAQAERVAESVAEKMYRRFWSIKQTQKWHNMHQNSRPWWTMVDHGRPLFEPHHEPSSIINTTGGSCAWNWWRRPSTAGAAGTRTSCGPGKGGLWNQLWTLAARWIWGWVKTLVPSEPQNSW